MDSSSSGYDGGCHDDRREEEAPSPDGSNGSSGSTVASFMTLEQKIEAMEMDVKQRLQAVEAAQREGAVLKEELARSNEVRQALLKKWHEARIAYDEVQLQLLEAQSRIDAASRELNDAQRLQTLLLPPPPRPPSSAPANHPGGAGAEGGAEEGPRTALEEELRHAHALVLQSEVQARVLQRFNAKLEAEVVWMQASEKEKRAALQVLHQEAVQGGGDGEEREMERVHKELVAYRGQIAKMQAAKAAAHRETEVKRRELEELKAKTGEMARRLQEEETTYMNHHTVFSSAPAPPLPASADTEGGGGGGGDDDDDASYGYGLSLACDA